MRQRDELLDEREDVLRREDAAVVGHVDAEPLVQLVAADLGQVVALGSKKSERSRLRALSSVGGSPGRCFLKTSISASSSRVVVSFSSVAWMKCESPNSLRIASLVARVEREPGGRVLGRQGAEQRRDRQLALAVDAGVDDALLVDLELEPRAAARHQVRGEDLLGRILRLHQVGAGAPDELRDDHALGAVDDERPPLRHHREVTHEDALLADLAGVLVDEPDGHRERGLIGQVLLAALLDGELGQAELVVAEVDGERAGVILDRRDVVDRLAEAFADEPVEGLTLDVDQVGEVEDMLETGKRLARTRRSDRLGQVRQPPLSEL